MSFASAHRDGSGVTLSHGTNLLGRADCRRTVFNSRDITGWKPRRRIAGERRALPECVQSCPEWHVYDLAGTVDSCRSIARFVNWSANGRGVAGQNLAEITHPDDIADSFELAKVVVREVDTYQLESDTAQGRALVWVLLTASAIYEEPWCAMALPRSSISRRRRRDGTA